MDIILDNVGRRFNQEWIFRNISYHFVQGESYAVLGPNGSGKSTLLQILSGSLSISEGSVKYTDGTSLIDIESVFRYLSIATPYLELIEEFTLIELLSFHFRFKNPVQGWDIDRMIDFLGLIGSKQKEIRYFSSGMKQRVKLLLACCTETPVLLLDEPTTNLDKQGVDWYYKLIESFSINRLVVVCSNQPAEYAFCKKQLLISDYK